MVAKSEPASGRVNVELLALALDSIAEGSLITDAHRNTIYANAAFMTITGYSWDEIKGKTCAFLQGPATSEDMIERIRVTLTNGEQFSGRVLNYRKDGSVFWNDLLINPMRDASGSVTHFVSVQKVVGPEGPLTADSRI
jgi:PAS domain S-box-containing protein